MKWGCKLADYRDSFWKYCDSLTLFWIPLLQDHSTQISIVNIHIWVQRFHIRNCKTVTKNQWSLIWLTVSPRWVCDPFGNDSESLIWFIDSLKRFCVSLNKYYNSICTFHAFINNRLRFLNRDWSSSTEGYRIPVMVLRFFVRVLLYCNKDLQFLHKRTSLFNKQLWFPNM